MGEETVKKIDELLKKYGVEPSEVKPQVDVNHEATYYGKQLEREGNSN